MFRKLKVYLYHKRQEWRNAAYRRMMRRYENEAKRTLRMALFDMHKGAK